MPLDRPSPVVGKPQEVERAGALTPVGARTGDRPGPLERDQPGLRRVEGQAVLTESLRERAPLAAVLGHKQDRINHVEVLVRNVAMLARQVLLNASKLFSSDFHRARVSNICASVNRP